jgi:hypothetical protein
MQKSHFFVSRKQIFSRPSAIIGVAMNNFVKWLVCGGRISPTSPMGLIRAGLEPIVTHLSAFFMATTAYATEFNGLSNARFSKINVQ